MCGIVGFIGQNNSVNFLKEGLKRLEYRGYDSAGITVLDGEFTTVKTTKRIENLDTNNLFGKIGIGHTRWATHGRASIENAHPHLSNDGKFAAVHNGIIENYQELKTELQKDGIIFKSETDTEVIPNLIKKYYKGDLKTAVITAVSRLKGAYALGIICSDFPEILVCAKKHSPLIIGISSEDNYIASDISAINRYTDKAIYLKDGELAFITPQNLTLYNEKGNEIPPEYTITENNDDAEKGEFPHYMLKEIYEQPEVLTKTFNDYIKTDEIYFENLSVDIKKFKRIDIVACGSAYHVGVCAKYLLENLLKIPVNAEIASEYRYRNPLTDTRVLTIAISQSGETADTIFAIKEAKKKKSRTLSIVNVKESTLSKETDDVIYTLAGPEIAVATTKGYLTQLATIYLLGIFWAKRLETASTEKLLKITKNLKRIPQKVEEILQNTESLQNIAKKLTDAKSVFFIGRNTDWAISLEASLKLKEISYIHAESYPAGELKHGTISLIEEGTPVFALCLNENLEEKTLSNIKEVSSRGGFVIACTSEGAGKVAKQSDEVIILPKTDSILSPLLEVIPFQLISYYTALYRNCDIDKPRNLAKSVTVE